MEDKAYKISLPKHPIIAIKVIPGHFATSTRHINFYLDVSELKTNALVARDVAEVLAIPYLTSTLVDTIVCMERTEIIASFLAQELLQPGTAVMNSGGEIHIVSPINNAKGEMVFLDSVVQWIHNKNVILLDASVSSARAIHIGMDCIAYYGGRLAGISALFVASPEKQKDKIHTLFTSDDIPGYRLFEAGECEMCKAEQKIDALISSDCYTKVGE
jgi:orotate phosphoribosyltransferase